MAGDLGVLSQKLYMGHVASMGPRGRGGDRRKGVREGGRAAGTEGAGGEERGGLVRLWSGLMPTRLVGVDQTAFRGETALESRVQRIQKDNNY